VYVSGKLGAGKSSLAFPLAAELEYSLTKDLALRVSRRGRGRPSQRPAEARGSPADDSDAGDNGQVRPAGRHRPADHRGHHRAGRRRVSRRRSPPPAWSLTPNPEPNPEPKPRAELAPECLAHDAWLTSLLRISLRLQGRACGTPAPSLSPAVSQKGASWPRGRA